MKHQLLTDPLDCAWLRETHLLRRDPPPFLSFELFGNEDCPDKIILHRCGQPTIFDDPLAVYELDQKGRYRLLAKA